MSMSNEKQSYDVFHHQSRTQSMKKSNKDNIISTADDAVQSKLAAVNKGYYIDPFIQYLALDGITGTSDIQPSSLSLENNNDFKNLGSNSLISKERMKRRMGGHMVMHRQRERAHHQPLIRRGTFARTCIIDRAISSFLALCHEHILENTDDESDEEIQVVMLGSGRDTTYFRAKTGLIHGNEDAKTALEDGIMENVHWYEIDHEKIIREKKELLSSCPLLNLEFEQFDHQQNDESVDACDTMTSFAIKVNKVHTSTPKSINRNKYKPTFHGEEEFETVQPQQYHLVTFDLCDPFTNLIEILKEHHSFKLDVPTLFVMECVQMYIPEQESRDMLKIITNSMKKPVLALFDPIIQDDAFGKVMTRNLTKAKIISNPNMSLLNTRTLQSQIEKLYHSGFNVVTGCDFLTCYETIMDAENRSHANDVEMLDEIEEWVLIMRHYCFVVGGVRDNDGQNCIIEKLCSVGENNPLGFRTGSCTNLGQ